MMVLARAPFGSATTSDAHYKALAMKKYDAFWESHGSSNFSDEFKDLFQGMIFLNPTKRPTLNQIL